VKFKVKLKKQKNNLRADKGGRLLGACGVALAAGLGRRRCMDTGRGQHLEARSGASRPAGGGQPRRAGQRDGAGCGSPTGGGRRRHGGRWEEVVYRVAQGQRKNFQSVTVGGEEGNRAPGMIFLNSSVAAIHSSVNR
jgi:hypothetical protein